MNLRHLGPSTNRFTELDADNEDVDIEQCSDSEAPKTNFSNSRNTSPSPSEEERLTPETASDDLKFSHNKLNKKNSKSQQTKPKIVGSCNCDELRPVQCHLETKELWDKFNELGTEMIITKSGRYVSKKTLKTLKTLFEIISHLHALNKRGSTRPTCTHADITLEISCHNY